MSRVTQAPPKSKKILWRELRREGLLGKVSLQTSQEDAAGTSRWAEPLFPHRNTSWVRFAYSVVQPLTKPLETSTHPLCNTSTCTTAWCLHWFSALQPLCSILDSSFPHSFSPSKCSGCAVTKHSPLLSWCILAPALRAVLCTRKETHLLEKEKWRPCAS